MSLQRRPGKLRRHAGFSLVELLVAMTLGLVLLSGMVSVFVGNKRSAELNSSIANMQESARFALDAIAGDIRSSGFQGCLPIQSGQTDVLAGPNPLPPTADFLASAASASVVQAHGSWAPAPPPGFDVNSHDAIPGTQTLTLQFGDPVTRGLRAEMRAAGQPSPAAAIPLTDEIPGAERFDIAIISNCEQADIFTITDITNSGTDLAHAPGRNSGNGNLSLAYGNPRTIRETSVMLLRSNVYYVGDTGQTNQDGDPIRALYRQSMPYGDVVENPPIEIVTGIENLRVAFGIRQAAENLRYVTPDSAEYDPSRVESVRIGLLMASRDRIAPDDDAATYFLAGQPIMPGADPDTGLTHGGDARYRLAFNTTVKVRNRRYTR